MRLSLCQNSIFYVFWDKSRDRGRVNVRVGVGLGSGFGLFVLKRVFRVDSCL